MMFVFAPRDPMYVNDRNNLFQLISMSLGSSPEIRSLTCLSEAQTARLDTADVPVISPHPVTPSSVFT